MKYITNFWRFIPLAVFFLYSLNGFAQLSPKSELKLGDIIRNLNNVNWVWKKPVPQLKKGKINIIELTSINCKFCRRSMPYLKNIVKKHDSDVNLVAIYLEKKNAFQYSSLSYSNKVKKYVSYLQPPYPVGVDDTSGTIYNQLMKHLEGGGVPQVYVLDKNGKIAWTGHPMELESVITVMLKGAFDPEKEASMQAAMKKGISEFASFERKKEFRVADSIIDRLIDFYPPRKPFLYEKKFRNLYQWNPGKGYAYLNELFNDSSITYPGMFLDLAQYLSNQKEDKSTAKWVVKLSEKARRLSKEEVEIARTYILQSRGYFQLGKQKKTIRILKRTIKKLEKQDKRDYNASVALKAARGSLNHYLKNTNL